MSIDPFALAVMIGALAVAAILLTGVGGFARGGEFNRKHANRIMRYRVAAQFVVVLLALLFVYVRTRN